MLVTIVGRGNTRTVTVLVANKSRYDGTEEEEGVDSEDDEEGTDKGVDVA
jgi:hypothetical protein